MRLFIAIELSEEIQSKLCKIQTKLKSRLANVKWVKPNNIHLTLKFIGEVNEEKLESIKKVLDEVSQENYPFQLALSNINGFPRSEYAKVIWAGPDKGNFQVSKISSHLEDKLYKMGFPKEKRPFAVHITIGRSKKPVHLQPIQLPNPPAITISHITLFQSTLTPTGPIYTPLHHAKLLT